MPIEKSTTNIDDLLGEAYHAYQLQQSLPAALAIIRKAIADEPIIEPFLRDKHRHYSAVHDKRNLGIRTGDHISRVMTELLDRIFP